MLSLLAPNNIKPFLENILQALHRDQSILGKLINLVYVRKPLDSTLKCTIKGMSYVPIELFQYPSSNYRIVNAKQNCWSMGIVSPTLRASPA